MTKSFAYLFAGVVALAGITAQHAAAQETPRQSRLSDTVSIAAVEVSNNGYQTTDKNNLTGAVSMVKESRIKELMPISIDALLQGQAAGVSVINTSGAPGSGAITIIRGRATLNAGTTPLYIVDGIPVKASRFPSLARNVDNNPLADINPQDIASISILKDGHATALYGMRGANGVIVINTYGGTSGKTYLDFSGFTGVMDFSPHYNVLNADQYKAYILEKEQARGFSQSDIANGIGKYLLISTPPNQVERYNNNTDWQNQFLNRGMYHDYHLNLRGGDAIARYSLNIGYTKSDGVVSSTNFDRFSARFILDYKVGKKLSFLNTLSYTRTDKQVNDEGSAYNTNPLVLTALKSPTLTAFQQSNLGEDLRNLDSSDYAGRNNPYAVVNGMNNKTNSNRISGRITGQYSFSPDLNLRVAIAADYYRLDETRFTPSEGFAAENEIIRSAAAAKSYELMLLNENTLNYTKNFQGGKKILNLTVGTAYQNTSQDSKTAVYINAPSDLFSGISSVGSAGGSNPQTDPNIDSVGSFSPSWKLLSFFTTAQYAIDSKYIFGANLRADGSSRFANDKRWGYFPSASAAWRLSKEAFLKNSRTINEFKLRASYGVSGNQEVGYYNAFNALISSPYNRVSGIRIGILGNRDFQWENTKQFDAGLDVEFLNGRVALNADYYIRQTDHLYNNIKLPGISGIDSYAVSEGSVRNKGIELNLSAKILKGAFGWEMNVNGAYNKNTIGTLPDKLDAVISMANYTGIVQPGSAIGAFYGYNALGVYSSTSQVNVKNGAADASPFKGGDIIFEDLDKNGVIDQKDRKILGNSNPDFFGGFYNLFSYHGFDVTVLMDFAVGNEVFNANRSLLESMSNYDNQSTTINTRWRKEGDITSMPRLLHGDAVGNTRFSSRWIEDGSYARFKALTLGYNLPLKGFLNSAFKNARVLITAQNLHTFSKYKGASPEVANVANPIMYGVDNGNLPQLRAFLLGVKLGL